MKHLTIILALVAIVAAAGCRHKTTPKNTIIYMLNDNNTYEAIHCIGSSKQNYIDDKSTVWFNDSTGVMLSAFFKPQQP